MILQGLATILATPNRDALSQPFPTIPEFSILIFLRCQILVLIVYLHYKI